MDRNTIRKEIVALVNSIKGQSDTLANEKYPSQLDLELFLHKVEKLYQKSIVFNHLNLFDDFEEKELMSKPSDRLKEEIGQETSLPSAPIVHTEKTLVPPVIPSQTKYDIPIPEATERITETKAERKEEHQPESATVKTRFPDLKSSIGINDKFQFTNDLFKGNMQEFHIAIEQLNASETLDSAMAYISGLQRLYNWDEENETVKRLLNLVQKRYI